jgi:putative ABC transport system permease protein
MPILTDFAQDARFTARQLRRNLFYSITVIVTVALAIGATAAMTGVLRATLLNPLPYPHSEQLVELGDHNLRGFKDAGLMSVPRVFDLEDAQQANRIFSSLGFFYYDDSSLAFQGHVPIRISAVAASGSFFSTIGTHTLLGRTLTPADDVPKGPQTAVLSYDLWQSAFAADPLIVGRTVRLGTAQATIVGVMPQGFDLPAGTELWHPAQMTRGSMGPYRGDGVRFVVAYGRLAEGQTLAAANLQTTLIADRLARLYPQTDSAWAFSLVGLRESLFGDFRHALLLLAAAVLLVVLVAAVNVAGLQLSRNAVRQPEFEIRSALGITRFRLVKQLLTESILLVAIGSIVGVSLSAIMLRVLASRLPAALLRVQRPHVDGYVLSLSFVVALVVGVLTGLLPALRSARQPAATAARTVAASSRRLGSSFTALQIALALVLLTLSASVLQGLYALVHTRLGFQPEQLQTFTVDLPWGADRAQSHRFYAQVESSLHAMPGVSAVGAISALPLQVFSVHTKYDIVGQPPTPMHDAVVAEGRSFSPGYLHALRIPLLAGRNFTAQDGEPNAPPVLLINQTLARRYFPKGDAVGKRLNYDKVSSEIVGIVGDVHGTGGQISAPLQPEAYTPEGGAWPHMNFAIRTQLPAASLEPSIRRMVLSLNSSSSLGHFVPLSDRLDRSLAQPRLNAGLLTSFAVLSVLLVVIGVYGLVAFHVAQRTRELGLRIALGSTRAGVLALLLGESIRILIVGLALGAAGSFFARRLLAANLTDAQAYSLPLMLLTSAILAVAVLLSTLIPARRASRLDPMQALKSA